MSVELDKTAFLTGAASGFLEQLHVRSLDDPAALTPEWREFFAGLGDDAPDVLAAARGAPWKRRDLFEDRGATADAARAAAEKRRRRKAGGRPWTPCGP